MAEPSHGLLIDPTFDAALLTNRLLGSGIALSGTPTYTGSPTAAGLFSNGLASGIGIDEGIILTTGDAVSAVGPNTLDDTGAAHNRPGDALLNPIAGADTFDAAALEFSFSTPGGTLAVNYVFASEEYNEFVNSGFNDAFGFFLDGVNIALVPGAGSAVTINSINNTSNPFFYNDNDPSDLGLPTRFALGYDGFTDVLTATVPNLAAGTHTIRLTVADGFDQILDSAVFLEARAFAVSPIPLPAVWSLWVFGLAALGLQSRSINRK